MIGVFGQPPPQETEMELPLATEQALNAVVDSESMSETILKVEAVVAPRIPEVDKQLDWTRILIELAVINLVLIIIAAGVWLFLRGEKDKAGMTLTGATGNVWNNSGFS